MFEKTICRFKGHDTVQDSRRDTRNNQDLIEENCGRCGISLDEDSGIRQVIRVITRE